MRKIQIFSAGLACLVVMAVGGDASAKPHRRPAYSVSPTAVAMDGRGPVVIERRSWLDPGTQVPVGSTNRYMLHQTYFHHDPIERAQRSWYMQETLPQRPPYYTDQIVPYDPGWPFFW